MNNSFTTNANALRELLALVDTSKLSMDGQDLLNGLFDMVEKVDPDRAQGDKTIELCDLCSYEAYTLWAGKEDVEFQLQSGAIDTYNLSDADISELAALVAKRIDWNGDCFTDCTAGNDEIQSVLDEVSYEMLFKKPLCLCLEPEVDPNLSCWRGHLNASALLMEKLSAAVSPNDFSFRNRYTEGFSCLYDPVKQAVELYGSYWHGEGPGTFSGKIALPLSEEESKTIASNFELASSRLYDGKNCLSVLNEERTKKHLPTLKMDLMSQISSAQDRKASEPTHSPQEHTFAR